MCVCLYLHCNTDAEAKHWSICLSQCWSFSENLTLDLHQSAVRDNNPLSNRGLAAMGLARTMVDGWDTYRHYCCCQILTFTKLRSSKSNCTNDFAIIIKYTFFPLPVAWIKTEKLTWWSVEGQIEVRETKPTVHVINRDTFYYFFIFVTNEVWLAH